MANICEWCGKEYDPENSFAKVSGSYCCMKCEHERKKSFYEEQEWD
jgi:hypothetical protein